jgi:FkbM family methyltransferase
LFAADYATPRRLGVEFPDEVVTALSALCSVEGFAIALATTNRYFSAEKARCSGKAVKKQLMDHEKALQRGEWLTRMRPLELALFLKWALRVKRIEADAQGIKLWVDPASNFGKRILREGNYEAELSTAFRELLSPGQNFVDVGANEGWFSMLAANLVGLSGRVLACEPQERLWPVITKNIFLNGFANVQLLPFAVAEQPGEAVINLYPSINTGSSNISATKRRWETQQRIKLLPLTTLLISLRGGTVDLMKVDVEGFEHQVLLSAGEHLGSTIKRIVVELHPAQLEALGSSEGQVVALLESRGYSKRVLAGVDVWELR